MTKILIVEDEPSFSEALEFLLGKEGFAVVTAENGSDAIKKFELGGLRFALMPHPRQIRQQRMFRQFARTLCCTALSEG